MCGIVGYIGKQKALAFLTAGLKDLEYRGYDSCGIALIENGRLRVVKTRGEVDLLIQKTKGIKTEAFLGLGHTRWATHGRPSISNAHPHFDCFKKLAIVHNGIIENYQELKEELVKKGHRFVSQTDTEVLAHLIEECLKKKKDLFWAVGQALKQIVGAYGIGVISVDFPDQIIAARLSSPLILGFGKGESFIASDQPALLPWTKKLGVLKDGQIAKITADGIKIKNIQGQAGAYQKISLEAESRQVDKAGFSHFMLKEIFDQPEVIQNGLRGRFGLKKGVKLGGIEDYLGKFQKASHLLIVGCGTSFHAALAGQAFFRQLANLPTFVENATDLVGGFYPWKRGQPVVFASQSGETADVLTVLRAARRKGIFPFGLVNIAGSSLARETRAGVYLRAGFEIGVAATKTFTAQMLALLLWAILIGRQRKVFRLKKEKKLLKEILLLPRIMTEVLEKKKEIKKLAERLKTAEKIYLLGRGLGYPLGLEGALKIKEIAYLPSEGLGTGELKHGPLALVDRKTVLLFLLPDDDVFEKNLNSLNEAAVRGGKIFVLTNKKGRFWEKIKAEKYFFPGCEPLLSVFPMASWLQLFSYYLAASLGQPIDKPRNLAKSVTVE
jgi:glucosamine--fructose-6-phosphate aminotransferase (isomerizing)